MKNVKWNYIKTISTMGQGFEQYISENRTLCKNIWFDGYEEVFEIA